MSATPARILSSSRDLVGQVRDGAAWEAMSPEERTRWAARAYATLEAVIELLGPS